MRRLAPTRARFRSTGRCKACRVVSTPCCACVASLQVCGAQGRGGCPPALDRRVLSSHPRPSDEVRGSFANILLASDRTLLPMPKSFELIVVGPCKPTGAWKRTVDVLPCRRSVGDLFPTRTYGLSYRELLRARALRLRLGPSEEAFFPS